MRGCLTLILVLIWFIACHPTKDGGYNIIGHADGIENALVVVETRTEGLHFIDSTRVQNGEFEFNGLLDEPTYFRITITDKEDNRYRFGFLAENSEIDIKYDVNTGYLTISGSKSNDRLDSIRQLLGDDNETIHRSVKEYKDSYEYTYLVYEKLIQDDWKRLDTLIGMIDGKLVNTKYITLIKSEIDRAKNLEIGGTAPEFTAVDINGKKVSLSDYRGKLLLLDFGASWCPDCIKEQDDMIKLYNRLKGSGFEVVNVACEKNKASWINWHEKYKIPYCTISDLKGWSNEVAVLYNVRWLPTYYLIDENGIIVDKVTKLSDLGI